MADAPAMWAVLVYVAADTPDKELTKGATKSLERLRAAGSTDLVKVAAQADFQGEPTRRFAFPQQPNQTTCAHDCVVAEVANVNSGSKQALCDFLEWGRQQFPAENTMAVLWGHGFGTDDYDPFPRLLMQLLADHGLDMNEQETPHVKGLSRDVYGRLVEMHPEVLFASMPDFGSRSQLKNRDVGDALREVRGPLAILGMDACTMAMAEVWLEMLGGTNVAVGSEYEIPYNSWPYDAIVRRLQANPAVSAEEFGTEIVDEFARSYSQPGSMRTVTLSACDLRQSDAVVTAMTQFVTAVLPEASAPASRHAIFHARNRTLQFDSHGFIDLRNFCELVAEYLPKKNIVAASAAVDRALDRFVIASQSGPSEKSKLASARGLSVYFPRWIENPDYRSSTQRAAKQDLQKNYSKGVFTTRTGWHRLLLALIEEEQSLHKPRSRKENTMGILDQKGRKKKTTKKKKKPAKKKKH